MGHGLGTEARVLEPEILKELVKAELGGAFVETQNRRKKMMENR